MTEYCDECGAKLPTVPSGPGQAQRLAKYCDECGARVLTADHRDDLRKWSVSLRCRGASEKPIRAMPHYLKDTEVQACVDFTGLYPIFPAFSRSPRSQGTE